MSAAGGPEWVVREDAGVPVLLVLFLRRALGIREPHELPHLRGTSATPATPATEALEQQWRTLWDMTVEPQAHPSSVPLELVDGFDMLVALPAHGFDELRAAIAPHSDAALAYARDAHERYRAHASAGSGSSYRAYASAIAEHERAVGRRAHSFELNVQVLPLAQRGVWWIGALTVAVTDGLRGDIAAFDRAIGPVIAELA
ncbi:zinc-binding alcohol dehydrogenase [Microbacterium sp.]|uniref:zinc-binding alcohol dehydrogenase n=1 Tax=Microbacterium sp. TaxID=51671 RepID=UPI003A87CA63